MEKQDGTHARQSAPFEPDGERNYACVCTGGRCLAAGAAELRRHLLSSIAQHGTKTRVKTTGCLGPCGKAPVMSVEPDGEVYSGHSAEAVDSIVENRLASGQRRPATETPLTRTDSDFFRKQTRVVLRNVGRIDPTSIEEYREAGGYEGLERALRRMTPDEVIDEVRVSGLLGRGGRGIPTWKKWRAARDAGASSDRQRYVICNADEGDPDAIMDRGMFEGDPHSVLEGLVIAGYAVGATRGFVYVRAEYPLAIGRLRTAIDQAREAGVLGDSVLGTEFAFDIELRAGVGSFVGDDESALLSAIEGGGGKPRKRSTETTRHGLWGAPTVVNNVETWANIPAILSNGGEWLSRIGTAGSPGTKVVVLSGALKRRGLVEVAMGTPLGELIYEIGGGTIGNKPLKAVQIGGPCGGCVPKEHLSLPIDFEHLNEVGAVMGSGGIVVLTDRSCMVDVARAYLDSVTKKSCGRCAPCRTGTKRMLQILNGICEGEGTQEDITRLEEIGNYVAETSLCGLGQTAPNPVLSTLRYFRDEYEAHISEHRCEAGICSTLVRAPCQGACPAGVDVPGFVSLAKEGRYEEALRVHRDRNPFAAVCSRVCFHPCEGKCRREHFDQPVSIRAIKRFLVDQEESTALPDRHSSGVNANRPVAIVGGGPAGLSCAYFLARLGYRPTVFEAETRPGGMLVQTIPVYRLPRESVEREIAMIEELGVTIRTGVALGRDISLAGLRQEGYEAVFLAIGAPAGARCNLPGEDAAGVEQALHFLREFHMRGRTEIGRNVIVIGGGNAAVDAARTAVRLGAHSVSIVYRRNQEQMPAFTEEVHAALEEGVELRCLTSPAEILTGEDGSVTGLLCNPMTLGDFDRSGRRKPVGTGESAFSMEADQVILAIGQSLDVSGILGETQVELTRDGFIAADQKSGQTSLPWLFSGGDASTGPQSVVAAIAAGERAAVGIDTTLSGAGHAFWRAERSLDTRFNPYEPQGMHARAPVAELPASKRRLSFDEVELAWSEQVARRECERCLRCEYGKIVYGKPIGEVSNV